MTLNEQVDNFVRKLPADPGERIYVAVYNDHFVEFMKNKIQQIKGEDYANHVKYIVPDGDVKSITWGPNVYVSPVFYNHVGNGYN